MASSTVYVLQNAPIMPSFSSGSACFVIPLLTMPFCLDETGHWLASCQFSYLESTLSGSRSTPSCFSNTNSPSQFERFMSICCELQRIGIHIPVKHCANSAGIIEYPEMHLDMVRPGIILYGMYPSEDVDKSKIDLKPAMTLKANVIMVKEVEKNTSISYGRIFTTNRTSRIATIPIGYADGFARMLSNKGKVLIHGEFAPVVGRICMDQCMVDVTDLEHGVEVGDEVVLIGPQGENRITAEDVAQTIGMINYELVCIVGKRIPRAFVKDGKISKILNYLI
jgi:alanine racemase